MKRWLTLILEVGRARRENIEVAAAERNDPYTAFNFLVEIDGMTVGGFSEVSGIESTVDVIEYRGGDEHTTVRKLPGVVRYPNLVLKRGWTEIGRAHV